MTEESQKEPQGENRRKHPRIDKTYIFTLFDKSDPGKTFEVSQIKNISQGGICFVFTEPFEPGAHVSLKLRTPYVTSPIDFEGVVVASTAKIQDLLYEVRISFKDLSPAAQEIVEKIERASKEDMFE